MLLKSTIVAPTLLLTFFALIDDAVSADPPIKFTQSTDGRSEYHKLIHEDKPTAHWSFTDSNASGSTELTGRPVGNVKFNQSGPRSPEYGLFGKHNQAMRFPTANGYLSVPDPGNASQLDFDNGDAITIEAWVNPQKMSGSGFHYIVGKGRTGNKGFAEHNQNYALRLRAPDGALSFLFRSAGTDGDWHRWTSKTSMAAGTGWHHVAVSYSFGDPKSIRGYLNGKAVKGVWDMGGATTAAPVVDNDEVRVGGGFSSGFSGLLDEVAIYRRVLEADRIKARYQYTPPPQRLVDWDAVPHDAVQVDIFEGLADGKTWDFRPPRYVESFETPTLAFIELPKKYDENAVQEDRSNPLLIRAAAYVRIPTGQQQIMLRARNAARLYIDDQLIAQTPFHSISGSAHGKVFDVDLSIAPHVRPLARGDSQKIAMYEGDGQVHKIRFEMIVGGRKHRLDLGESSVSTADPGEDFRVLSPSDDGPLLTNEDWLTYVAAEQQRMSQLNKTRRKLAGVKAARYWQQRHQAARREIATLPPLAIPTLPRGLPANNEIDRFIGAKLVEASQEPTSLLDDLAFLRRVTLDAIGTVPTAEQIDQFMSDAPDKRRQLAIDRLLQNPGWADSWMGYWQDVLAENPNIIKPKLNNSGPFRWWLHESFLDNKPFDRFVTELLRMEGGQLTGGPAGFAMATQNDAPMAAKAQIVGRAFLGLNMACARCHDAPYHDFKQRDLFSLAAMLNRGPQNVPATSSIPGGDAAVASLIVNVTLKPGAKVTPEWTFDDLINPDALQLSPEQTRDQREQVAALITAPQNKRFAEVLVNRVWQRFMGRGIVEPVDDWQGQQPSHPQLLDYLAREFVSHDYDLKHLARLIFNSHAYQRVALSPKDISRNGAYLFAGPVLRRMTAEQLIDSLFAISEKPLDAGALTLDIDGSLAPSTALHLGVPTRAWQFTSLSNERDRPSLSLPFAQPFVTTLETFGWRSSRQNPISVRDHEPTVRQPAELANGIVGRRLTRLSPDNRLTQVALEAESVDELVKDVYQRMLTREPTDSEQKVFHELLADGFSQRRTGKIDVASGERLPRGLVSWSNHLSSRANEIQIELQRAVEQGDRPTVQLDADWRERLEDMIWTLMNTPEFVYLP